VDGEGWLLPLRDDPFDTSRRRLGGRAILQPVDLRVGRVPFGPLGVASRIRGGLESAVTPLPPEHAAILLGLTVGDARRLTSSTVDSFRRAGLSHLLVVSGENVAMVVGAIALVASRLGHRARVTVGALGLALYVLVVGPQPSVLRAAAMGGLALLGLAARRRIDAMDALCIALIVVIGWRPALVFSVGLHLSAAATAGIILWARSWSHRFRRLPRPIRLALGVTLAAQAAVAPILLSTFGQLSLIAPLSNLLAVPAVAPATILGACAGLAGTLSGGAGSLIARAADPFVAWIAWVGHLTGDARWSAVDLPRWMGAVGLVPVAIAMAVSTVRRG
jgi:competence protein ComEC